MDVVDFGGACAVDGDTMVVGGAGENFSTGAAYVYTRSGTAWTLQQTLRASDADHELQLSQDEVVHRFADTGLHEND